MKILSFFKTLIPLTVALGMISPWVFAHEPGFVHNASSSFTKAGEGCLHTTRWKKEMGECGVVVPKMTVRDSDGDGVNDDKDRCPGTPSSVRVDVHGCGIDSDGDGVADYEDRCAGTPRGNRVDTRGCEIITKIIVGDVNFDFDNATIQNPAKTMLDDAASQINRNASVVRSVRVTGYTDSTGPEAYNQKLSERRANTVKGYLESRGISGVTASGAGESNPVGDNRTREGRAMNRRVEIDVSM